MSRCCQWLPWCCAAAFLAVGVPLFVRMPLWCDATLYAVAARTIATGGVHYRDVFDTNPPGFVWLLWGVRGAFGTSGEALRAADLLIVGVVAVGLLRWARTSGASRAGVAWAAAALAAFYPFTEEFNHIQRDVWMMLPAGAALALRLKRVEHRTRPRACDPFLEGFIWGVGCWVKPHLLFVAFAVWLATRRRQTWRDHIAVFAGGLTAGVAGVGWLVGSGAWPYFFDIWTTWNADYLATVMRELPFRIMTQLSYFPPYSVCALAAVPLAVANLRSRSTDAEAFRRKVLAATYLAWLITALLLQRPFHYVHVPETLLMLGVFAANRWPLPFALVLLQLCASVWFAIGGPSVSYVPPHPAFDANRTRWWAACFDRDPPRELRRGVAMWAQHFGGSDPVELGAVADYLRTKDVRDGELIAWHDSPHALYLTLGIKPGFRFMHVGTAANLGKWQEQAVLLELQHAIPHARFVVSDMHRVTQRYAELNDVDAAGLPKLLPAWQRAEFPWNQPVLFRSPSGRYLVHRVAMPVKSARIPEQPDQAEPPRE